MNEFKNIDLNWRPGTYWPDSQNRDQLLSNIKGQARREITRHALESGGITALNDICPEVASEVLSESAREGWGAIHPDFMGGEYLPSQYEGEIEIARISLKSTTADQISVRASWAGEMIHFNIVDEYSTEFILSTSESDQPLSLGELINLLESTNHPDDEDPKGMIQGYWHFLYDESTPIDEVVDFVSLESAFYDQLSDYYSETANSWMKERESDSDEDGDECDTGSV